jgi:ectoine hydroxylase
MDKIWLEYCLTDEERRKFDEDGYFILEDVLPPELVAELEDAADRVDAEERAKRDLSPYDRLSVRDFIGRDDHFFTLIDWYKTFPKIFGILGWNLQIYHSHLTMTPPAEPGKESAKRLGWHQDSGRLNFELESNPRPRVSLKVAYFLSDCTEIGRANFYVAPGSHLQNDLVDDRTKDPENGQPVLVPAGGAVFFDRRLWHAASGNTSNVTRKVLFYGYSYRWLRPRDDMTVERYMERSNPIQQQLLGASPSGGHGFTSPSDADVPLRGWMKEHLGEEAIW